MAHMWRSKENLEESVLSYHVGSGDQTQVIRCGSLAVSPGLISTFLKSCRHTLTQTIPMGHRLYMAHKVSEKAY